MKLTEVCQILGAEVLTGEDLLEQVEALSACGADLMSDVLAFTKERTLLLTGLTNPQVVRTAELVDLCGLVFVRGKRPPAEVVDMAKERRLPVLLTSYPLYETCGLLYSGGLAGCQGQVGRERR
ncbi:MAG: DRTGG domain-containing protein [Bacteroidota bacterium]